MRSLFRPGLSACLALSLVLSTPAAVAMPGVTVPGSIEGKVWNPTFTKPLAGVTVAAFMEGAQQPLLSVVTDTHGRFALRDLPGGGYLVLISRPTGEPLAATHLVAEPGVTRTVGLGTPDPTALKSDDDDKNGAAAGGSGGLGGWIKSPVGATVVLVMAAIVVAVAADRFTDDDDTVTAVSPSSP